MVWGGVGVHRTWAATRATQQNLHRGTTCGNPSGPPPSHSGQKRVALLPLSGIPCGTHPIVGHPL